MRNTRPNRAAQSQSGELRIIAGRWRSRKLSFSSAEGLRPTSDRIRETLFSWLDPYIVGASCLDLFAGSGALGLEALSRDAASCDFVDNNPQTCRQIQDHLQTLSCNHASIHCTQAESYLARSQKAYDIIFLDPPFQKVLLQPAVDALAQHSLKNNTLIYIETAKHEPLSLPEHWQINKEKTAGQVCYRLIGVVGQS